MPTNEQQLLNFDYALGPVLFPQAPIGPDTSGVRVGASGFGFVPPGGRGRGKFFFVEISSPIEKYELLIYCTKICGNTGVDFISENLDFQYC